MSGFKTVLAGLTNLYSRGRGKQRIQREAFKNLSTYISIPLARYVSSSFNMYLPFTLFLFIFLSVSSNTYNDFLLISRFRQNKTEVRKLISKKYPPPFQDLRETATSIYIYTLWLFLLSQLGSLTVVLLHFSKPQEP